MLQIHTKDEDEDEDEDDRPISTSGKKTQISNQDISATIRWISKKIYIWIGNYPLSSVGHRNYRFLFG